MGQAAAELADFTIITTDNRSEFPPLLPLKSKRASAGRQTDYRVELTGGAPSMKSSAWPKPVTWF